jgi:undecaprenyl-phosphate 4-deoxy-4-formamido-L-arabinose transferase
VSLGNDVVTAVHPAGEGLLPGVSVVIPVFNSAKVLPMLVARLAPVLEEIAPGAHELILVNDGSLDESWAAAASVADEHHWVRASDLMRNYGQHNALLCGLRSARHEITVTMDDDLQHPPEELPKLLERLEDGFDVVYGIPLQHTHSPARNLMSRLTKATMAQAMDIGGIRDISAFRALRTELRSASASYASPTVILDVLLSWGTIRFGTVKVRHEPRAAGDSGYTIGKLFNHTMLILTGFSTKPLRMASLIGFVFTAIGAGVLAFVVAVALTQNSVPGFPFLASLIAIFGGVQLFALGILGEYLARMFERSMDRPPYAIRCTIGAGRPREALPAVTPARSPAVD